MTGACQAAGIIGAEGAAEAKACRWEAVLENLKEVQAHPPVHWDPGHSLWSVIKLVLGACVLYKEAEDSDPAQARVTVGAQLMFVDERMNKAKNW